MRPLMLATDHPFTRSVPPFPGSAAISRSYRLREPITAPAEHGFRPNAINDRGDIIGAFFKPARFEGAVWQARGVHLSPHGHNPAIKAEAESTWPFQSLSSSGLIAGTHGTPASARRAWASHLGVFGERFWPDAMSFGQDVNAAGVVVGKTLLPAEPLLIFRAFYFGDTGRPRYLTPPDGGMTDAVAINNHGTILLNATSLSTSPARQNAWLFRDDTYERLETPPVCSSIATALGPDDSVVGYVGTEGGLVCAARWVDGRLNDLGTPFEAHFRPTAVNAAGVIVGNAKNADGKEIACRWTDEDGLQPLSALLSTTYGGRLVAATGINAAGQITAAAENGERREGFVLEPDN